MNRPALDPRSHPLHLIAQDLRGLQQVAGILTTIQYLGMLARTIRPVLSSKSLMPADGAMPKKVYRLQPIKGRPEVLVDTLADGVVSNLFSAARELYFRRVYLRQPGFSIGPEDTILDLGANVGLFTILAAVCGRRVVAVEAQSGFLPYIHANLERNDVGHKADIIHGILAPKTGMLKDGKEAASHWGVNPKEIQIPDLIDQYNLDSIDFLKIDIEGSEFGLFNQKEDLTWLNKVHRIAMEVHPPFGDPNSIANLLKNHGLETWITDNSSRRVASLGTEPTGFLFARRAP
jgi:FkbM family methyltransferase